MRTFPLVCTQTWYLPDDTFAIELAADHDAQTRLRFVTRNRGLYQDALQAEGHDIRIAVDWHWAGTDRVLDAIHPVTEEE